MSVSHVQLCLELFPHSNRCRRNLLLSRCTPLHCVVHTQEVGLCDTLKALRVHHGKLFKTCCTADGLPDRLRELMKCVLHLIPWTVNRLAYERPCLCSAVLCRLSGEVDKMDDLPGSRSVMRQIEGGRNGGLFSQILPA